MLDTLMSSPLGSFSVRRYPARKHDPLQAWEGADLLLHERVLPQLGARPLLVNDSFAAIAVGVERERCYHYTDSIISHYAYQQNLSAAQRASYQLLPCSAPPADDFTDVVLKVPKSLSLLDYQLAQLAAVIRTPVAIYAAAKSKLFSPAVRQLFAQYCTDIEVSLVMRKARLLSATLQPRPLTREAIDCWPVPEYQLELCHHAGVFARNQLDIGARLLLEHLPAAGAAQVIDLGCGNGVLGIAYARRSPQSAVLWVDESYLAVASAALNIARNLPADDAAQASKYQTRVDDCLQQQAPASADLILCNPPFHQEHAITSHIAEQMFRDAYRVLKPGGELRVVANRHLNYQSALQRHFRRVKLIAQNPKFVVLSVTR